MTKINCMETPILHFIDTINDYIICHDMTPTSFAREIGCLERCVARWLNKTNTPSLEYVIMVADYMHYPIDYLFGITENSNIILANPRSSLSERLKFLIFQAKVSKNKLAKICGVTSSTVSKWILRGQLPKPDIACLLAHYFNCSTDYLVGRTNSL